MIDSSDTNKACQESYDKKCHHHQTDVTIKTLPKHQPFKSIRQLGEGVAIFGHWFGVWQNPLERNALFGEVNASFNGHDSGIHILEDRLNKKRYLSLTYCAMIG